MNLSAQKDLSNRLFQKSDERLVVALFFMLRTASLNSLFLFLIT